MPSLFVESESRCFLGSPHSIYIINAPPFHLTYAYNKIDTELRLIGEGSLPDFLI